MLGLSLRIETLILTIAAITLAAALAFEGAMWHLDHVPYDRMMRAKADMASSEIVVVAIDQRSLQEIGSWPWSRRTHAELIERLTDAGASVIGLNIIFAESSRIDPDGDLRLAEAMRQNGHVILPASFDQSEDRGQVVEILPEPRLAKAAAGFGHVDVVPDQDGIVRSHFLKAGLGSPAWQSLPLAMLQHAKPEHGPEVSGENGHLDSASPYAWTRNHRILFGFAEPGSHNEISYVDALRGKLPEETFRGRFVLVGVTAKGLGADFITPLMSETGPMSGVGYNAHVLDSLLQDHIIRPLGSIWIAIVSAAATLIPLLLYPSLSSRWTLPVAAAAMIGVLLSSLLLLQFFSLWLRPAVPIVMIAGSYPLWSWINLRHSLRYQRSLRAAHERALVTLHSVDDAVLTTDASGAVQDLNSSATRLTGHTIETARGQAIECVLTIVDEHSRCPTTLPKPGALRPQTITRLPEPAVLVHRDGQEAHVRATAAPINDAQGATLGMVLAIADVTETRRLTEQMSYLATHDPLTGLPNRVLLEDRLRHAIDRAKRENTFLGVLFVDLDQFKTVNDGLGHSAGDALLKLVGQRLKDVLREADTVARFGGDEFVIILENITEMPSINTILKKLQAQFDRSFRIEAHELQVSCSIGVVVFPRDGDNVESILKNADTAMYRAKQLGRANAQIYTPGMEGAARDQLMWSQRLQKAIRNNELVLYYQPQVDVTDGRVKGVEALVRWNHPELGLLMPDAFVPVAESTSLIQALDDWVIREANAQLQQWRQAGLTDLRVAVNLSPRQLAQPNVGRVIANTINGFDLNAPYIELEITERTIMHDLERTIANLRELKSIGVTFAIDDFGTGYSSLSHLTSLPVDRLKIDRSFIRSVPDDAQNTAIASAIIAMGKSLGLSVVAEGVETPAQVDFLRAKGCNEAQGYLICHPMPTSVVTPMLHAATPLLPRSVQ